MGCWMWGEHKIWVAAASIGQESRFELHNYVVCGWWCRCQQIGPGNGGVLEAVVGQVDWIVDSKSYIGRFATMG